MTDLTCKSCGGEDLGTAEAILGTAEARFFRDDLGAVQYEHTGYTHVHWDSSTTTGYACRSCGHESETPEGLVAK
jgi:hypothetical protein